MARETPVSHEQPQPPLLIADLRKRTIQYGGVEVSWNKEDEEKVRNWKILKALIFNPRIAGMRLWSALEAYEDDDSQQIKQYDPLILEGWVREVNEDLKLRLGLSPIQIFRQRVGRIYKLSAEVELVEGDKRLTSVRKDAHAEGRPKHLVKKGVSVFRGYGRILEERIPRSGLSLHERDFLEKLARRQKVWGLEIDLQRLNDKLFGSRSGMYISIEQSGEAVLKLVK